MKCRAEEKLAHDRVNKAYKSMGKTVLSFLDASAGCMIHKHYGYGKKRLSYMFKDTMDRLDGLMEHYGSDGDDTKERADISLYVMIRRFAECGFDFKRETENMPAEDPFTKSWHPANMHSKHKHRVDLLNSMELVVQTYHAMILLWFRENHGYGAYRLLILYRRLRADYNLFVSEYLRCSTSGDANIQRMLSERQKKIEEIGLELVDQKEE